MEKTLVERFHEILEIIDEILDKCAGSPDDSDAISAQKKFVAGQLEFACRLGADLALLRSSEGSSFGQAVIGRTILEVMFRIAGAEVPQMAVKIMASDVKGDFKYTKKTVDYYPIPPENMNDHMSSMEKEIEFFEQLMGQGAAEIPLLKLVEGHRGLESIYRVAYNQLSKISHADYTFADICYRGEELAADPLGAVNLALCLSGSITAHIFGLSDSYRDRLWILDPDLRRKIQK